MVIATGNNLIVHGDMVRRTLACELDPKVERPELRKFDFYPVDRVLADRGRYVAAALTIIRAYLVAGQPDLRAPLISYREWSDKVRSALVWLGETDPITSMEETRELDPELNTLREVIAGWGDAIGFNVRKTASEIAAAAELRIGNYGTQIAHPAFREAMMNVAGDRGAINVRSLGRWLSRNAGRIAGGKTISRCPLSLTGAVRYALLLV
jgi:hypothetical protein